MAYLFCLTSFLVFFSVSAVTESSSEPSDSSNNNTAPSVKFSGSYDPLKKPKSPYQRIMRQTVIGSCERDEAKPILPLKGKVTS